MNVPLFFIFFIMLQGTYIQYGEVFCEVVGFYILEEVSSFSALHSKVSYNYNLCFTFVRKHKILQTNTFYAKERKNVS